jgi:hypothetical protein
MERAVIGLVGVACLSASAWLVPAVAGPASGDLHGTAKCPVDHHTYASAQSATHHGSAVTIKAKVGKKVCGQDGGSYTFGKKVKTLTVHKSATVKVLKNIMKTAKPARIPVSRLPHYINRSFDKNDDNIFQYSGKLSGIKRFVQVFIS